RGSSPAARSRADILLLDNLGLAPQRPPHRLADAAYVQTQVGQQLPALGVFDKAIRDAEPPEGARAQPGPVRCPPRSAAAATLQRPLLHRHHQRHLLDGLEQRDLVEWLDKTGIDDADVQSLQL